MQGGGGAAVDTLSNHCCQFLGIESANVALSTKTDFGYYVSIEREDSAIGNFLSTGSGRGNIAKPNPPRELKWIDHR
jgi:hypothetical protein